MSASAPKPKGATVHKIVCAGCSTKFDAKSPQAKWCSRTCRQRNARAKRLAKATETPPEPSRLVERLREELEEADVAETFDGLLALELAERVVKAGPQGFSMLARDLRAVRAAALGEDPPAAGAGDGAEDPAIPAPDPGTALVLDLEERRDARIAEASAAG